MPDSQMITLRVSPKDHDTLRAVANYCNESLSAFVRASALASAEQIIHERGWEAVLEGDRTVESRRATDAQRRLAERLERLRVQAGTGGPRD